jgi:pantetheine-phosphate adenylyltransferase
MTERRIAVYPASFDPITNGHLDLIHRASRLFDEVVVAVATNLEKSGGTFPVDERIAMVRHAVAGMENVRVDLIQSLLVEYLQRIGARIVLRGLRALADFEYEFEMALMNSHMFPEIETVFLMTSERWFYVSASRVRELVRFGADVTEFVPPDVAKRLAERIGPKRRG